MENLLSTALESGLGAVALIALIYFVIRMQKEKAQDRQDRAEERKQHKEERETWKATSEKQFERLAEAFERQTRATAEYTGAVQALRDLIKGQKG